MKPLLVERPIVEPILRIHYGQRFKAGGETTSFDFNRRLHIKARCDTPTVLNPHAHRGALELK